MGYDKYRERTLLDALKKGTGFLHLYYSEHIMDELGDFKGALACENIDMQNVAVSNPRCKEIQNNKWIIIKKKESVGSLKKRCKKPEIARQLVADLKNDDSSKTEIQDSDLVYVYLRYYRKNGEVHHSLSTESVDIYKDVPLNPNLIRVMKSIESDEAWVQLPDDELENQEINSSGSKFWRYPIEPLVVNESDDSIYGITELKDTFNTQIAVNQASSMVILNAMNTAWDKWIVLPNALRNQKINDQGGQVLTDYSGTGTGIRRAGGMNAMANGAMDMAQVLINTFRSVNQITDFYSGENNSGDIAAAAIAQLNEQADKPIDIMRKSLWRFEEEVGKTIDLFIKTYYRQQSYEIELTEAELIQQNNGAVPQGGANRFISGEFNPDEYKNVRFNVICETTQGIKNSELIQENLAQTFFVQGAWNNMDTHSRKFYLEMSPLAQPVKDKMLALAAIQEQDEIGQMQQAIQQLQEQNNQLVQALNRAKMGIDYQTNMIKSLQKGYKNEVKAHQDDIKVRDDAAQQLLGENEMTKE